MQQQKGRQLGACDVHYYSKESLFSVFAALLNKQKIIEQSTIV